MTEIEESSTVAMDIDASYEAARAELPAPEPESDTIEEAVEETAAPEEPGKAEEPEHLRWVKSVSGNVAEDGTIKLDAVTKQAYELNRQNQAQAQQIAQIRQLLADPKIVDAIKRATQGEPEQPKQESKPESEKTDEEIFRDLVLGVIKPELDKLNPTKDQASLVYQSHLTNVKNTAMEQLKKDFSEGPVTYDQIDGQVGQIVFQEAQRFGMQPAQFLDQLAAQGNLYPALRQYANAVAWQMSQQAKPVETKPTPAEPKRNPSLSRPGTPSQKVAQSADVTDIFAAAAAAKRELAQRR